MDLTGVLNIFSSLSEKFIEWIDKLFSYFEDYSEGYKKWFVYAMVFIALSKLMKVKVNLDTGKK